MSVAIPNFTPTRYGLLSGALFTSLFSITVLFSGVLSDNCSRRLLLSAAAVLWSITSMTTAISQNYSEVAVSRMMLGFFEAFCGPPAFSLEWRNACMRRAILGQGCTTLQFLDITGSTDVTDLGIQNLVFPLSIQKAGRVNLVNTRARTNPPAKQLHTVMARHTGVDTTGRA